MKKIPDSGTIWDFLNSFGAPGRIRTRDPLVRSQVLYPTELRAQLRMRILYAGIPFVNFFSSLFSSGSSPEFPAAGKTESSRHLYLFGFLSLTPILRHFLPEPRPPGISQPAESDNFAFYAIRVCGFCFYFYVFRTT